MHTMRTFHKPMLAAAIAVVAMASVQAQPVGNESSPVLSWDPYGEIGNANMGFKVPPDLAKLSRERATRFFDAVKLAPTFQQPPQGRASYLTALPSMASRNLMQLSMIVYWTVPKDARRQKDGALFPVMGGAHEMLYFAANRVPHANSLGEIRFRREALPGAGPGEPVLYFSAPKQHGELAGGTVFDNMIVITRDGRPALAPAPLGELLQIEVARLSKNIADQERIGANILQELDASMTPDAVAARRDKRAQAWAKETRDPQAMTKRLDAAHRSDESYNERRRQDFVPPATRDPKTIYWSPRLALEAAKAQLATLDTAGRAAPACVRVDAAFRSGDELRFQPAAGAPADCEAMVQVRPDLIDPARPASEVQLFTVSVVDAQCGRAWSGTEFKGGRCFFAVPLLREMDWGAARRALGW